jgi:ABC-2 type transport system permease protein
MAMLLFRLIGPRRARSVAQVLAALIGAAFFLVGQSANLASRRNGGVWLALIQFARTQGRRLPPEAAWTLHAMIGRPAPLAAIALGGAGFFALTAWSLGNRFVADAAAASGAAVPTRKPKGQAKAFASSAFAATYAKEMRLLWRDVAMLAQVLLRVLYLLPLAFVILRNAHDQSTMLLPFGVATLCVAAGQVASSLVWITVAAEDLPALLASAPAPMALVRRAKLAAAMTPLAIMLALPLIALTVFAPASGIAATIGCAATAWATGLIAAWRFKPAKRSDFRARRRGGISLVTSLAIFFVGLLIGAAAAMASVLWALIPAGLAGGLVLALRRSDAQMAQAMAAGT